MIRTGSERGLAAHRHGVDADNGIGAGGDQAAQRELTDDAEAQHGRGPTEREPRTNRGTETVPRDDGNSSLLRIEFRRQAPQPPTLVAEGQQFRRRMIAGKADAIARLPTLDVGATSTTVPAAL